MLRVGTCVLFHSVPFMGYLFFLADGLCPICPTYDQVSFVAQNFLVSGKRKTGKLAHL